MKQLSKALFVCLLTILFVSTSAADEFQYRKWFVTDPILQAGQPGTVDDISVKDPTIVYHDGKYHLFYTSKASREAALREIKERTKKAKAEKSAQKAAARAQGQAARVPKAGKR